MERLASWTEIGRTGGRTPHAMLSIVEYAYQTQFSGISTIAERLRYYAFHCWWFSRYADTHPKKSTADFGDCARRFELLYALASLCFPDELEATSDELGISGANHAAKTLQEGRNQIDFRHATARETPVEKRYIKPTIGDFANSYWKSRYLTKLSDEMIDLAMHNAAAAPSDNALSSLWNFGGATAQVPAKATAFGDRSMGWMYSLDGVWSDPADDAVNIAWGRDGWAASERFGHNGRVYLNFPGHGEDGDALTRASFGANYRRLAQIKAKYDPANRLRFNQNIAPEA